MISNVHLLVTPSAVRFVSYGLAYTFTCWDSTLPHLSHHKREINSLAALLLWKYAVDAVAQLSWYGPTLRTASFITFNVLYDIHAFDNGRHKQVLASTLFYGI